MSQAAWNRLRKSVIACQQCSRLVQHTRQVAIDKRKAYLDQNYWGQPVADFGGPNRNLLVVGLAPGAHGANRTGRMFTGDRSGDWLYRAMYRFGFASQPESRHRRDGLKLIDASVTNVARCAPPGNRPTTAELQTCTPFFLETMRLVAPKVIIALGQLAWNQTIAAATDLDWYQRPKRRPKFAHGMELAMEDPLMLIGSYHPSQQNTFTGRLTEAMLDAVFRRAREIIDQA